MRFWVLQLFQWRVGTLLKLTRCTCWGFLCSVKQVKLKASKSSDSWIANEKTVMSSLQLCIALIAAFVWFYIENRGERLHRTALRTFWSNGSSKSDSIIREYLCRTCRPESPDYPLRALSTGILSQHHDCLVNVRSGESFTLHRFTDIDQITQMNTILLWQ